MLRIDRKEKKGKVKKGSFFALIFHLLILKNLLHGILLISIICMAFIIKSMNLFHSDIILLRGHSNLNIFSRNLLFKDSSEDSVIKIVDFGFAHLMPDKEKDGSTKTPCFTVHYAAPEVLLQAVQKGANGTA